MKGIRNICLSLLIANGLQLIASSCSSIDLYEKSVSIPGHSWQNSYKPSFTFTIKDNSALYDLFLVMRHNEKYNYNNIWLNIAVKTPGSDTAKIFRVEKTLATNEEGWLGSGMDDLYEHRIRLTRELVDNDISLRKPGEYSFTIEQIMRENPLKNIFNIGLRIEKQQ